MRSSLFEHRAQRGARDLRVVRGQALVRDEDDTIGAVAGELRGCVRSEDEGDVVSTELPGELSALGQEFEGGADRPAADELDEGPAVVALRRRLGPEALRLVPARR